MRCHSHGQQQRCNEPVQISHPSQVSSEKTQNSPSHRTNFPFFSPPSPSSLLAWAPNVVHTELLTPYYRTDENCRLSIGLFGFSYNALGGDVVGVAEVKSPEDPVLNVRFERMQIPPLDSRTGAISMPITNRNILPVSPILIPTPPLSVAPPASPFSSV